MNFHDVPPLAASDQGRPTNHGGKGIARNTDGGRLW
jgi:hypothetical protein